MSRQKLSWGKMFEIWKLLVNTTLDLGGSELDLARLLNDKERVQRIGEVIVEKQHSQYRKMYEGIQHFTPIPDHSLNTKYWPLLAKYRFLASMWGVEPGVDICYRVCKGFSLKDYTLIEGFNPEFFEKVDHSIDAYLVGSQLEITKDCLVFWIPKVVPNSFGKDNLGHLRMLSQIRTEMGLPEHHLNGFGTATMNTGLILSHFKRTGQRLLAKEGVRTGSYLGNGFNLCLGNFRESGLSCDKASNMSSLNTLGVFALGVEETPPF